MKLYLGMDDWPTESLRVRIKKKTNTSDIVVSVCYRLPDQEEVDEVFYRQLEVALRLQTLVLMGDFNHSDICWSDNTAQHKQPRRFLKSADDNFLTQVIEKPMRRGVWLDLILADQEGSLGI